VNNWKWRGPTSLNYPAVARVLYTAYSALIRKWISECADVSVLLWILQLNQSHKSENYLFSIQDASIILMKYRAGATIINGAGETPLHIAARYITILLIPAMSPNALVITARYFTILLSHNSRVPYYTTQNNQLLTILLLTAMPPTILLILFREANRFSCAMFSGNCEPWGTDNTKDKYLNIYLNGGYCVYYPSNIFRNTRSFENWEVF